MRHFFHGHSFAGNPIACAAALASLEIFNSDRTLEHVSLVAEAVRPHLEALSRHDLVNEVRGAGLMIGVEIASDQIETGDAKSAAWRVADALYERGYFTRPIGDVVQLVPPLSSTVDQVAGFIVALAEVLQSL
jgi:adenosylmethionine-8-amino-7-oxononanoate aminotransferase